ncbi:hypothetical protein M426DRAFT_50371 [Hypoxylon sp. CI-4A]|nr:hypothetical protein M426DRAFT_50371 [Hypoxylon sp. CI-4A]
MEQPIDCGGLSILNPSPQLMGGPDLLHDLIALDGEGGQPAIEYRSSTGEQTSISYPGLHSAADALAARITESLRPIIPVNDQERLIVPILVKQSPALYIGLLAILKAGAAFCPLNLDTPRERLKFILKDIGASLILVDPELASKLPLEDGLYKTLPIDLALDTPTCGGAKPAPSRIPNADDLAYVMYTSGSTGTPKGVGITHRAVTQSLLAHNRHIPSFARFLQFAASTFDVSVFEIFFPLFRGSTLVCCSRPDMLTDLPGILRDMRIDACELTPSVAGSLLKKRSNAPGLRLLLTIGEMLTEPVIQEFGGDEHEDSILWGMYGPTEATIHCTLQASFLKKSSKNNIGIPLDTVSAFVIDSDTSEFRVVPLGEAGELAIGGSQLATGYINRPEQTSAAFIDTRWSRVYRTGDRARILPDGTIECLGRINDGQVKLNGQRIELGELEHVVLRTPRCHGAFAAVISNVLVAFAAVEDDPEPARIRAAIISQCKSWLPAFMIPADIKIMNHFPRLPSGKVDKKTIVQQYESTITDETDTEEIFQDEFERRLCEIAEAILKNSVTPSTHLPSLGLDSLAAIEYALAIRTTGINIRPVDVLSVTTPRELFHIVEKRREAPNPLTLDVLPNGRGLDQFAGLLACDTALQSRASDIEYIETCSALQEAMVVETLKDKRLYMNQTELRFPGHLAPETIKSWFVKLAEDNEILRTGFAYLGDKLYQVIWKRLEDNQIEVIDSPSPFECDDVESFLRHPFKLEIIPSNLPTAHRSAILTLHHSIYDGWTIDLLVDDLLLLARNQVPVDRPQFRQVAQLLAATPQSDLMDAKEFWAEVLHDAVSAPLPNFKTTFVPEPKIRTVSRELKTHPASVGRLVREASLSPQVIFQACLSWLWGAINGIEDVIIGSVSSGRTLPVSGIEKVMGPYMTTLPLRPILSRYNTINELMQGIHMFNREALKHDILPLAEIKRASGISLSQRLFELIFAYQETLASRRRQDNTVCEARHSDAVESKLLFEITPREDNYSCQITWHSDSFSEAQVDTVFQHLDILVDYFAQNPEEPLSSISQCFPVHSLSLYNENPKSLEIPSSLARLVEETASKFPTREALVFASSVNESNSETQIVTYDNLNSRANRIARYLQHCGANSGGIIALVMEKSPLLYCSILAILKTGCAYLPILPNTPPQRVQLIFEQAQPQFCLTDISSLQIADTDSFPVVNLSNPDFLEFSDSNLGVPEEPTNLAYIIYTSGTTGIPKGVSVTHRNILSNIKALSRIYPHGPSDRMLQACSQAFDMSVFEIFFPWANGMCLCSATNDTLFADLEQAIRALKITHLGVTVTVASLLDPARVPGVQLLATAGEPMTDKLLEKWTGRLWQGYGPSETTNICTVRKVSRGDSSQYLGWSFENTSTFVLSLDSTDLVPLGCVGELCFGGEQVAAGYLQMPELTAAKFIEHREYGRLYRSGDIGRMLPDGSLIILGRIDTQVKLRGLRIELQDIQATVFKTGLARACTSVLVTVGNASIQQLALFYVPNNYDTSSFSILPIADSTRPAVITLRQELQAALPDYMVPSFIFPISALPLTTSGKVDYDLLRHSVDDLPDRTLSTCSYMQDLDEDSSEFTESEILVLEAISKTLHIDKKVISRWSSFAVLGIDSISAIPLARALQTAFQKRIPLSLILSNPSVGRLASVIAEISSATNEPSKRTYILPESLVEVVRQRLANWEERHVERVLPCTPLQEAMLYSSSSKAASSYCNQMLFKLRVPSEVMKKHWDSMFHRHEILRTFFVTTEDAHYPTAQVVLKSYLPQWKSFVTDEANFQEYVSRHAASLPDALDSGKPPLSLVFILRGSTEYLSFVCHHAIYDGVSVKNLLAEIEAESRHEQLPPIPSFESFLRETLPLPAGADEFWSTHLKSFSAVHFDKLAPGSDSALGTLCWNASTHSYSSVTSRLRDLGISLLSLCQTTWAITLSLLQGNSDVCFGNVVSGRSVALDHIDTLVAPCFNTIPIRMNISSVKFLQEVMKRFQQLNPEMVPYRFTGLRKIQSLLSSSRLFDTVLILQPQAEPLDESIWSLEYEQGAMDVPLVCEITPIREQDTIRIQLHPDPSIFSQSSLLLIQDIFQHIFHACLERPFSHVLSPSKLPSQWRQHIAQLSLTRDEPFNERTVATIAQSSDSEAWSKPQAIVRAVLSKLTQVPETKIGLHTPIYRYGLDSIGALQLATLLRRESCAVSAVDVIENPTCAGIASHLNMLQTKEQQFSYDFDRFQAAIEQNLTSISSLVSPYEALLPCTPTQQGMISQFLNSDGAYYFNYASWTLRQKVDPHDVATAWSQITTRHQILRSGFVPVNHQDTSYVMIVYSAAGFPIPVLVRDENSFNIMEWRAEALSKAMETLLMPAWQVVIVEHAYSQPTMHLAMHHALYDGRSLLKLLQELAAALSNTAISTPLPIQSAISARLNPANFKEASEAFWRGKAPDLVVNKFPTMTPLHTNTSAILTTSWTCGVSSDDLRHRAAEAGVTVRAALQAAWTRILSSYLGEASVTFGIVLDGRNGADEQDIIFPMVTTLPVLAHNITSNSELLDYMMQYNTNLHRYERAPLSSVQRWLGQPDGQLFDTIIAYQTKDRTDDNFPWEVLDESASVEYPVAIEAIEVTSNKLQLNLTHNVDVLPSEQANIIVRQLEMVLVDLLTNPQGYANQLPLRSPDLFSILPPEFQQLPSPANLLHQLVERSARLMPTATALEFVEQLGPPIHRRRWTYHELDQMGNRAASLLSLHNIPPGSIVATCFNKCPEAYFSILGILKAGCAFLSLDPAAPASRLEFILKDSAAACLLIGSDLNASLNFDTAVPIYEISESALLALPAYFDLPVQISPADTCYCLYTSGTTGTPKGCLISHENTVQAMLAFEKLFSGHWNARSRWLQFASFHFDVSVLEQYWSWFVGITVVAAPRDVILADIAMTISSLGITHIDLTPSLARLVSPDEVPSLCDGVFITGGEQLRGEILQTWGPKEVIYNAYGPTEATIGVTMYQRVPANGRPSNIGAQFPNVGTYVLEPGTETPVLRGGVGELCVSGKLVGRGYLNREDLTRERFPTLERYNDRVYRTGDLVRVFHDGSFDFIGRADDQVKLRGQRLEIGEINHAIKTGLSDQISDVVTFVTRHLGQDRDLLVSFLAPVTGPDVPTELQICSGQRFRDISQIALEACKNRLPGYMVPTYILCVSFIPLSANNKADIKRLKQLFADLSHDHLRDLISGSTKSGKTLNEAEQLVALAISAITRVKDTDISPSSSIFELGIDSINVARLALILQSRGFAAAKPALILRHPQIRRLSQVLGQTDLAATNKQALQLKQYIRAQYHRHIGMACRVLEIDNAEVEYIAPCTPLQEGMITRSKTTKAQSVYFNQFHIDLDVHISISRLKNSWDRVLTECAILRTAFLLTADGYIQVAINIKAVPWFEIDVLESEVEGIVSERRNRWIASNLDTIRYPIEIDYFEYDGKRTLLLRLFHAVYDGHSLGLILRRVNSLYNGELPTRFPAFVDVLPYGPLLKHKESKPFWERIFENYIYQPIPVLETNPEVTDACASRVFHINNVESRRITLGVTHQTVLQAAWLVTLHRHLGFAPTIGVVYSGRSLVFDGIENVIGPVLNTLPFHVDPAVHPSWASLIHAIQEYNTSVLECVHTPLRDIQKWCSNGQPLFDSLFTFDRFDALPAVEEKQFWSSIESTGTLDYPLALEATLSQDQTLEVSIFAQGNTAAVSSLDAILDVFSQALVEIANSDNDTPHSSSHSSSSIPSPKFTHVQNLSPTIPKIPNKSGFFQEGSQESQIRHEVAVLAGLPDEDIHETTNLFELGLDSIDSIKLSMRLRKLGVHVTVSELRKNPTIESILLSHGSAQSNGTGDHDQLASLERSTAFLRDCLTQDGHDLQNVSAVLPTTPLQDSMVADMLLSGFNRYFNHDVLEISSGVDINRLKSAWALVYAHSPILRTAFAEIDNPNSKAAFCQIVQEQALEFNPSVKLPSLNNISTILRQAQDKAIAANGTSGLFQLTIVSTPENQYLVLSIAHALYDGWSLDLLHKDVQAAYEGRYSMRAGYEPCLSRILFGSTAAAENFWADYLNDIRPTILENNQSPSEDNDPNTHRSELVSHLDPRGLKALCQKYRITPQVLAQGCWAPVLASMTNSLDVVFGVVLSGRDSDEAQELLFPMMNTAPLRAVIHGTAVEYFHYLQTTMSEIMEFQHLPLREVQKMAGFKGDKLFNTLFLLQNSKQGQLSSESSIWKSVHTSSAVDYPLCVEMNITENSVIWHIAGDEHYLSKQDVERTLNDLERVLQHFANDDVDVLEFDNKAEKVSMCGLEPFQLDGKLGNGMEPSIEAAPSRETSSRTLDPTVLDVLSELSGIEKSSIDPNHSIYHLGLDSISAIKASSMFRRRGLNVSVKNLLKAASLYDIPHSRTEQLNQPIQPRSSPINSSSVLGQLDLGAVLKNANISQADIEALLPALPMQAHMLSVWQNTDGLLFFPQFSYTIHGNISRELVSEVWLALVAENPILRTRFAATESAAIPYIQITAQPKLTAHTKHILQDSSESDWVYEDSPTPFILFRVESSHSKGVRMHLQIHHALYDGISLPRIMNRFLELCGNRSPPPLPAPTPTWHDFVLSHYSAEIQQQRQEFWSSYLRGVKPLRLIDRQGPKMDVSGTQQYSDIRRNVLGSTQKLKAVGTGHGLSLQALFFAAYSKALATSQEPEEPHEQEGDVVCGVYLANRSSFGGLEEVPFPTLSIVPLVARKPFARSVIELASEIQEDLLKIGTFENSTVGLWEIYDWTGIQIESCVNFLAAPGGLDNASMSGNVTIEELPANEASAPSTSSSSWDLVPSNMNSGSQGSIMQAYLVSYSSSFIPLTIRYVLVLTPDLSAAYDGRRSSRPRRWHGYRRLLPVILLKTPSRQFLRDPCHHIEGAVSKFSQ